MTDWGGAQWLMVFMFAIRAIIGLAKATGKIVIPAQTNPPGKAGEYFGARIGDIGLAVVLWWGGFF